MAHGLPISTDRIDFLLPGFARERKDRNVAEFVVREFIDNLRDEDQRNPDPVNKYGNLEYRLTILLEELFSQLYRTDPNLCPDCGTKQDTIDELEQDLRYEKSVVEKLEEKNDNLEKSLSKSKQDAEDKKNLILRVADLLVPNGLAEWDYDTVARVVKVLEAHGYTMEDAVERLRDKQLELSVMKSRDQEGI
jgi:hypothetical protein